MDIYLNMFYYKYGRYHVLVTSRYIMYVSINKYWYILNIVMRGGGHVSSVVCRIMRVCPNVCSGVVIVRTKWHIEHV